MSTTLLADPVLALIPARGGSKGVLRKNLRLLGGRPLVAWTLEAALSCPVVDDVYLSSDDQDILAVGKQLGANMLSRPPELATDDASPVGVVLHFIRSLSQDMQRKNPYLLYLQPTSPLRSGAHITEALRQMYEANAQSLISVCTLEKSPYKYFGLDELGRLHSLFNEHLSNARRQDLPPTFAPNGAIYIFRMNAFLAHQGFPSNGSLPYVMTEQESIDIDTVEDFDRIERLIGVKNG